MKKNIIFRLTLMLISSDLDVIWGQDYFEVMNEQQWHNNQARNAVTKKPEVNFTPKVSIPNTIKSTVEKVTSNSGQEVECRGMTKTLSKMGKDVICKPRPTLVKLNPDSGYIYIPDVILIDRCDGRCGHESQSCMPIETVSTRVLVQRMQIGSLHSPCWEIQVEKHTRCKCDCQLMSSDCNSRQKYNQDDCTCECSNIKEMLDCSLKEDMFWNHDTCRCSCLAEEETCSTGLMWIPSLCRCAKVMMGNEVPRD
ncbi:balbiani ring protein 3 isoform X1 [Microplitis demolitor]|uniref:balbiani ring protein 3 isoform X1 n=1 Tax=Microplitis demolitor TaxID=69319 RepID=UPI0004CD0BCB|nr:balbiani ring protein 3 isoform X1 [Microplitis demolitor]